MIPPVSASGHSFYPIPDSLSRIPSKIKKIPCQITQISVFSWFMGSQARIEKKSRKPKLKMFSPQTRENHKRI
jgi:hypothetical protein